MKKIILSILLISGTVFGAYTYTTNYNLAKPSDGETTWGETYRDNLDIIDSELNSILNSLSTHEADTTAHDASAIVSVAGTICAEVDVQSYLQCLDDQISTLTGGGGVTLTTSQTISGAKEFSTTPQFSALTTGIMHVDGSGDLTSSNIVDDDIDSAAAIDRSKLASGSADYVVINDGSGVLSAEATLSKVRGGTGADNSSVTFPSSGTITTDSGNSTFTNKTFDADGTGNSISNIENADIKSAAAIAYSKLNLSNSILNADINSSAAIAYSKLSLSNSILNADINSSAAIARSKLAYEVTQSKTANYTVLITDDVMFGNANSGGASFTFTLPTAVGNSGKKLTFIRTDNDLAKTITLDGNGSETIGGALTRLMHTQNESWVIYSDGSNWQILEHRCETPWTTYSTSWTGAGGNPAIGNGTIEYKWKRNGSGIIISSQIVMGSTTTYGSGAWSFTIPNSSVWTINTGDIPNAGSAGSTLGSSYLYDSSASAARTMGVPVYMTSNTFSVITIGNGVVSSAIPFTWATSDRIEIFAFIPITGLED